MHKLIVMAYVLMPALLYSQGWSVTIEDRDLEIPLEGVELVLAGFPQSFYTDDQGKALIPREEGLQRYVLLGALPGYTSFRYPLPSDKQEINITMTLSGGVIQGEELVIERSVPGESDEQTGVSVVVEAEELETTANIGLVEDVMSSVKTLPGVGYADNWNARPSVRGGYPEEVSSALDGFYVANPYYWGGGYTIFNPNIVDSVKLSHGIYSARYGRALAGLLEVNTLDPVDPQVHVDAIWSTTTTDLFVQAPLGSRGGILAGGKLTYLDSMKLLFPTQTEDLTQMPYIRDFMVKSFYKPHNALEFYLLGFTGFDGLGLDSTQEASQGITTNINFDYSTSNSFATGGMKFSPGENWFIHLLGGYNRNTDDLNFNLTYEGTKGYSQDFLDLWHNEYGDSDGDDTLVNGNSSYNMDGYYIKGKNQQTFHQGQGKLQVDYLTTPGSVLTVGAEEVFGYSEVDNQFSGFTEVYIGDTYSIMPFNTKVQSQGNKSLNSSGFLTWQWGEGGSSFSGEAGVRVEHFYLWNKDFSLYSKPVITPRISLNWTPWPQLSLSGGSGLFATVPLEASVAEEKYGLKQGDLKPNQALFNMVGINLEGPNGWSFQGEGYYKYYLSRLLVSTDILTEDYFASTEGQGWAAGADLLIKKARNRYWDAFLSYSYSIAQFKNPSLSGNPDQEVLAVPGNEPIDIWYYPYYHRFHKANLVLNFFPHREWTITVSGTFATGAPKSKAGPIDRQAAFFDRDGDGSPDEILERYSRQEEYSPNERTDFSIPIDIRIAQHWYSRGKKLRQEWYIGVEDILVNLYHPKSNTTFDSFTGEERQDASADFNIGIPIISTGYKVSY